MSGWLTLNVPGISPTELSEAFDNWWVYEKDGVTVAYSFSPKMSAAEAAAEAVKAGGHDIEPSANTVLTLCCNDTSDFVEATIYRPGRVKWNGVRPGLTWSGHHSFRSDDSEFLQRAPDGKRPVFAGNWKHEIGEDSPAKSLSDLRQSNNSGSKMKRVNVADWIRCPECDSGNVKLEHWGEHDDYRARVSCAACGAGGYFD